MSSENSTQVIEISHHSPGCGFERVYYKTYSSQSSDGS